MAAFSMSLSLRARTWDEAQQGCCCASFSSGELTCILTFTVWLFGRRCAERDVCRLEDGYCSPEPWTDLLPPGRGVRVKNLACFVCSKKIPSGRGKRKRFIEPLFNRRLHGNAAIAGWKNQRPSCRQLQRLKDPLIFSTEKARTCKAPVQARVRQHYLELYISPFLEIISLFTLQWTGDLWQTGAVRLIWMQQMSLKGFSCCRAHVRGNYTLFTTGRAAPLSCLTPQPGVMNSFYKTLTIFYNIINTMSGYFILWEQGLLSLFLALAASISTCPFYWHSFSVPWIVHLWNTLSASVLKRKRLGGVVL